MYVLLLKPTAPYQHVAPAANRWVFGGGGVTPDMVWVEGPVWGCAPRTPQTEN